jgi:hypothetical protein
VLSLSVCIMYNCSSALWCLYGLALNDPFLSVCNLVGGLANFATLVIILFHADGEDASAKVDHDLLPLLPLASPDAGSRDGGTGNNTHGGIGGSHVSTPMRILRPHPLSPVSTSPQSAISRTPPHPRTRDRNDTGGAITNANPAAFVGGSITTPSKRRPVHSHHES